MMDVIIHFLPAEAGDCSVLEFNNKECIIIDCGYKSTYYDELKPLLINLKKKGCKVILLIVTHIDQDHIEGAIELISENGSALNPQIIEIENIWFNGFFNTMSMNEIFVKHKNIKIPDAQKAKMRFIKGQLEMQETSFSGNISAKHSKRFEKLCLSYGYQMNNHFYDKVVKRESEKIDLVLQDSKLVGECTVTVLSPNSSLIGKLAERLNVELIKLFGQNYCISDDEDFSYIFENLGLFLYETDEVAENISVSETELEGWVGTSNLAKMNDINNASIVVEIKYKDHKLLFSGDSDSDYWGEFLDNRYEVIKLSHHGTTKPNQKLLEKTKAAYLLISTNGKRNNHPENDLIARAVLEGNKKIYFNYDIKQKETLLKKQNRYNFQVFFNQREIELGEDNNERVYS